MVAIAAVAGTTYGCGMTGLPVSGRVWDASSGQPVRGAIVVVRWNGIAGTIATSQSVCVHVETAVSDDEGRYRTPWWWQKPNWYANGAPFADAYLAGYESVHAHTPEAEAHPHDVYMKRFVGTAAERFEFISGRVFSGMSCLSGTPSERNLYFMKRAALTEAKALKVSGEQQALRGLRESAADSWLALPNDAPYDPDFMRLLPDSIREELR
jgi:hypothetical protein